MLCLLGPVGGGTSESCGGRGDTARDGGLVDWDKGLDKVLCCLLVLVLVGVRKGLTLLGRLPFRGGV